MGGKNKKDENSKKKRQGGKPAVRKHKRYKLTGKKAVARPDGCGEFGPLFCF